MLEKIKNLASARLPESELDKVIFLEPQDVIARFEEEAANAAARVDRVKGYKVNLSFQPVTEIDREATAGCCQGPAAVIS